MHEETKDRWGRKHRPSCTISYDDWRIVCMEMMDRAATSRIIAEHIQSVTHHSKSTRAIRRHLQQRVECPQGGHCFVYP
ncbi:hypothetical protein TNCV_1977251 [Trichonephila clavipes]|nr:hypothetical protein TNCV_1977251 [Trichonephila clavipes]